MCGALEDRDDFPPPPRRPDRWRTDEDAAVGDSGGDDAPRGDTADEDAAGDAGG